MLEKEHTIIQSYHQYIQCNGQVYREYHVDTHPSLWEYVSNNEMGGDLSVRNNQDERPVMFVGQDESVFNKYSFSCKSWKGPAGEGPLLRKSYGYTKMVSTYVSRPFGMGIHL